MHLKGLFVSCAALAAACSLPSGIALAKEITIVNLTGHKIVAVYARNKHMPDNLMNNRFDGNPISNGGSRTFTFHTYGACDDFNIEVDSPGNIMTKQWDVDFCGSHEWTWTVGSDIYGNAGNGQTSSSLVSNDD